MDHGSSPLPEVARNRYATSRSSSAAPRCGHPGRRRTGHADNPAASARCNSRIDDVLNAYKIDLLRVRGLVRWIPPNIRYLAHTPRLIPVGPDISGCTAGRGGEGPVPPLASEAIQQAAG
eukprot:scaffold157684_cov28-Tisochrysis_lutea.AAC.1